MERENGQKDRWERVDDGVIGQEEGIGGKGLLRMNTGKEGG